MAAKKSVMVGEGVLSGCMINKNSSGRFNLMGKWVPEVLEAAGVGPIDPRLIQTALVTWGYSALFVVVS